MKKTASFVLFALLCAAAGMSSATVHIECKGRGKCVQPTPPAPPVPPVPPAPPAPPVPPPDGDTASLPAMPALPAMPHVPAPPTPPAPPALPDVPKGAHDACASKPAGSSLTWVIKKGETMTGTCEREDGKMVFQLRTYHLDD